MMNRRSALTAMGATLSAAAVGGAVIPSLAEEPVEDICDKVERLAHELSAAMGEWLNGKFVAHVAPLDDVVFLRRASILVSRAPGPQLAATECVTEVEAYHSALARHAALFSAQDSGEPVTEEEVWAALDPIDDAVLALCRFCPQTPEGAERRRAVLSRILPGEVEGRLEWSKDIFDALISAGGPHV